ncbi:DUF4224 domain-containing protein [Undibacterium terreum]|nr:DUF4224 domain-containing protein [Undibacterium terreum]
MFEIPIATETLTHEEIQEISGSARRSDQIAWLQLNGWTFLKNRAGDPIVGRLYARLKLAGINPSSLGASTSWSLDASKIR